MCVSQATYANLVLGYLEEKLTSECKTSFGEEYALYIKNNWKRYLDDCFIFWTKSLDDLQHFHTILNSLMTAYNLQQKLVKKNYPFWTF